MTARKDKLATEGRSEDAVEGLRQALLRLASPRFSALQDEIQAVRDQLGQLVILESGLSDIQSQLQQSNQDASLRFDDLNELLQQARLNLTEIEAGLTKIDESLRQEIKNQTEALDAELNDLQKELIDHQSVAQRISPILIPVVSEQAHENRHQFAQAVAPVMGPAIRHQIRDAKQDIIDSLYPVIGEIISKAISESTREIMRNIDARMRQQFDLRSRLLHLTGSLRGVSQAELVLREALPYSINHVFLIHRATGLLLHHLTPGEKPQDDMDMISAMLTAIRDFVRDSFGQGEGELEEVTHGEQRILLESGQYAYLAIVVDGVEPAGYSNLMRARINDINVHYEGELGGFDGKMGQLPDFKAELSPLLSPNIEDLESARAPAEFSRSQKLTIAATTLGAILIPALLIFLCIFTVRLWPIAFPQSAVASESAQTATTTTLPVVLPTTIVEVEPTPDPTHTLIPTPVPTRTPSPTVTPTPQPSMTPSPVSSPPPDRFGRLEGTLNLREGPSTDYPAQGVVYTGERVKILREQDDWLFIQWPAIGEPTYEGWIWSGLVSREDVP